MAEALQGLPRTGAVPSFNGIHLKGLLARSTVSASGAEASTAAAAAVVAAAAAAEVGLVSNASLCFRFAIEAIRANPMTQSRDHHTFHSPEP